MKRIIFIAFTLLLVIMNFWLIASNKKKDKNTTLLQKEISDGETYKLTFELNLLNDIQNSYIQLNENIVLHDVNNLDFSLNELLKSGTKLIIRSSENGCGLCIENELRLIKKYSSEIGIENIIIITNFKSSRKLEVFKKDNNIDFNIYYTDNIGLPFEKTYNQPIVFVSDSSLVVKHFFIPEATLHDLSNMYYTAIIERYFANK